MKRPHFALTIVLSTIAFSLQAVGLMHGRDLVGGEYEGQSACFCPVYEATQCDVPPAPPELAAELPPMPPELDDLPLPPGEAELANADVDSTVIYEEVSPVTADPYEAWCEQFVEETANLDGPVFDCDAHISGCQPVVESEETVAVAYDEAGHPLDLPEVEEVAAIVEAAADDICDYDCEGYDPYVYEALPQEIAPEVAAYDEPVEDAQADYVADEYDYAEEYGYGYEYEYNYEYAGGYDYEDEYGYDYEDEYGYGYEGDYDYHYEDACPYCEDLCQEGVCDQEVIEPAAQELDEVVEAVKSSETDMADLVDDPRHSAGQEEALEMILENDGLHSRVDEEAEIVTDEAAPAVAVEFKAPQIECRWMLLKAAGMLNSVGQTLQSMGETMEVIATGDVVEDDINDAAADAYLGL